MSDKWNNIPRYTKTEMNGRGPNAFCLLHCVNQGHIRAKISGTAGPNVCPNEFCVPIKVISNKSTRNMYL